MLTESQYKPDNAGAWIALLREKGPIILRGKLGGATLVWHFILLVGASSDDPATFFYKDPLVGDAVKSEALATMQPRIEKPLVYANRDIMKSLQKIPAKNVNGLAFQRG